MLIVQKVTYIAFNLHDGKLITEVFVKARVLVLVEITSNKAVSHRTLCSVTFKNVLEVAVSC